MKSLRAVLVSLTGLTVVLVSVPAAIAADDTSPPALVSFTVSHTSVDSIDGPVGVTLRARLTDDASGIVPTGFNFGMMHSSGKQLLAAPSLVSGNANDGVYEATIVVSKYAPAGSWQTGFGAVSDAAGNRLLGHLGPYVQVTSAIDSTAPIGTLTGPSVVDLSTGPQQVTLELVLSDGQSGIDTTIAPRLTGTTAPDFELVSSDGQTARYHTTFTVSQPGGYFLSFVGPRDMSGNGAQTSGLALRATTPPGRPPVPTVGGPATARVLSWEKPAPADSSEMAYEVRAFNESTDVVLAAGFWQSRALTELDFGTYSFQVRARNELGWGPWSTALTGVTVTPPPESPASAWTTSGPGTSLVNWTAANGRGAAISSYTITEAYSKQVRIVDGSQTSYLWEGLSPGNEYIFRIVATTQYGTSSPARVAYGYPSAIQSSSPPPSPPTTLPTAPTVAPDKMSKPKATVRGNKAVVTWKAATDLLTGYVVDITKGKNKTVTANARRVVFKKLKPGTYRVRVAAVNPAGRGAFSGWVKIIIP